MYLQQTHLDDTTHEQTIIYRQLFADHVVGYQPMKWDLKIHQMIMVISCHCDGHDP